MQFRVLSIFIFVFGLVGCDSNDSDVDDADTDGDKDTADGDTETDENTDTDSQTDGDDDTDISPGGYLWHSFFGCTSGDLGGNQVADEDGNVYLTGSSHNSWNGPDGQLPLNPLPISAVTGIFVLKLDKNGGYLWHTFFGSSNAGTVGGFVLTTDNRLVVSGTAIDPDGQPPLSPHSGNAEGEIFVLELGVRGDYGWHTFLGGEGVDSCADIITDTSDSIYLSGWSLETWDGPDGQKPRNPFSEQGDMLVIKLNQAGAYEWHTFYGGKQLDASHDLVLDADQNIYASGMSRQSWDGPDGQTPLDPFSGEGDADIFLLKLDTNGSYQWHSFFGGEGDDFNNGLAIDEQQHLYLSGLTWTSWNMPDGQEPVNEHSGSEGDAVVFAITRDGQALWHTFHGGNGGDDITALVVGPKNTLYATGRSKAGWRGPDGQPPINDHSDDNQTDFFVLKLNRAGEYGWHTFYGGEEMDITRSIEINSSNSLVVVGNSPAPWNGPDGQAPLNPYTKKTEVFAIALSI